MRWIPIGLAACLIALPALAQTRTPKPRPVLTGDLVNDVQNAIGGGATPLALPNENAALKILLKPFQDIANFISSDNLAAAQLAVKIPELQDGNGLACLNAMATAAKVNKLHPLPLTLHLMSDVEAFRLNVAAINKLCDTTACTVIFSDGVNIATAAAPVSVPVLPSLSQLCSKVAHIQMATPAQTDLDQLKAETAAAAPAPASTPATAPAATPAAPANP